MRKVINVKSNNYLLVCEMENGDVFHYDMSFVLNENSEMLLPLQDSSFFEQVFIELGALSWPNGYEIHGDTVVRDGLLITQKAS